MPTAQNVFGPTTAAAVTRTVSGAASRVQLDPFQCRTIVEPPLPPVPVARMLVGDRATMSESWPPPPMVGTATRRHEVPLNCAMYGCTPSMSVCAWPATQTLFGAMASTAESPAYPGFGGGSDVQAPPFHRSATGTLEMP